MANKKDVTGLKIIIVGAGKIGSTLVGQLVKEGHDITVIDQRQALVDSITDTYDVMGITGNGASYSIQMEAGIEETDLLVAVTGSDELNLLCCTVAKQVAGCSTIARVRTPDYNNEVNYLRESLGLAMIINPEYEAALEASRMLIVPSALDVNSFVHGQAELIKFKVPADSKLDNISLMELSKRIKSRIHVCVVEREDNVIIPNGTFVLKADDTLSFVCKKTEVKKFLDEIGMKAKPVRNCLIVGGGTTSFYLATQLISMGIKVKIIESQRARCETLSLLLPDAVIINGDGTNEDLLNEEGIKDVDSFIPLTGIDEQNVLLALYAQKNSKAKVITKVTRTNFRGIISKMDIGSVLFPQNMTSEAITAYVRGMNNSKDSGNIQTLYHMYDNRVEAVEFSVGSNSKVTGTRIMDLKLKNNLLVSFIERNGKVFLPSGESTIESGDRVVIVTTHPGLKEIDDILA